jgi:hypothetical protein
MHTAAGTKNALPFMNTEKPIINHYPGAAFLADYDLIFKMPMGYVSQIPVYADPDQFVAFIISLFVLS